MGNRNKKDLDPEWTPALFFSETLKRPRLLNPVAPNGSNCANEKENAQETAENMGITGSTIINGNELKCVANIPSLDYSQLGQIQGDSSNMIGPTTTITTIDHSNVVTGVPSKRSVGLSSQFPSKKESKYYWTSSYKDILKKINPSLDVAQKTGKPFIQDDPCYLIDPERQLPYCRECPPKIELSKEEIVCRFFAFRLIRYCSGNLLVAGFSDPYKDISEKDLDLWIPSIFAATPCSYAEWFCVSKRILHCIGDYFCLLAHQEKKAFILDMSQGYSWNVFWKRVIGVRETCDVCSTSLFNYHWTCEECGFAVCIDCYEMRKTSSVEPWKKPPAKGKDKYSWVFCHTKPHIQKRLMFTQIIAGDSLIKLEEQYHEVRKAVNQTCTCQMIGTDEEVDRLRDENMSICLDVFGSCRCFNASLSGIECESSVRNLLMHTSSTEGYRNHIAVEIPSSSPTISWLCNGRLLWLQNPSSLYVVRNAFQVQWKDGLPVLISEVTRNMDHNLWKPEAFSSELGDVTTDFVDCTTGLTIPDQPMKIFWDGFNNISERLHNESGNPMILKLKDWPPGDDFAKVLPKRFADLMKALPMAEYTHRSGPFNLASWLPESFIRPDLGPKMYTAYGSAHQPSAGTTNLHLDMSDAVNVLVYVGLPTDGNSEAYMEEVLKVITEAGCDSITQGRVRQAGALPGALWHIYPANDAGKIRVLLSQVADERGMSLESHDDPIHDQSWYLDKYLRDRLYYEFGVEGYTIVQCLGDAIFIPAGAPHQVLNLHNCIKVAEDFVSPENVSQCFQLANEFRGLSDTHHNHEDKLQIKNILYHAVKAVVSILALPLNHNNQSNGPLTCCG